MSGFVKVYSSILDSSIWLEPDHVLRVWIAMLALADPRGMVEASVNGLARRANIDRALCEDALARLMAPDPDSKTPDHEGRRIETVRGGWLIYNYRAYRERGTSTERVKRLRAKGKGESVTGETLPPVANNGPDGTSVESVTNETHLSSSCSTASSEKKEETKRDVTPVTPVTRGSALLETGELVQRIRALAMRRPNGEYVIPAAEVEKLGTDIARAYTAIGGSDRFLAASGKDYSWLVKEFGDALEAARRSAA